MTSRERGALVEQVACRYLQRLGMRHLHSNFRAKSGELDLIMMDAQCVVFVEVRYRRSERFGGAALSIDAAKQRRLRRTADCYLRRYPKLSQQPCRFDVICASGLPTDPDLRWIRSAF